MIGRSRELKAEELVVGDIVVLNRGDRVPADVRLVEAIDLRIGKKFMENWNKICRRVYFDWRKWSS